MTQKETLDSSEPKKVSATNPPEKEFFDREADSEESGLFAGRVSNQKRVLGFFLIGLALILIFVFAAKGCSTKHSETKKPLSDDEKRETVTQSAMERAIQNSRPKEEVLVQESATQRPLKKKERSFKSDIAVYVYQDKSLEKNVSAIALKKKKSLGLPAGTKVPALLEDRVFSFNVAAPVLAIISKDFSWNGKSVIPKGSKFLGEASVLKSLDRINVNFDLLILPDGSELRIKAMALAEDGASGIRGKVDKHRDTKVLKAIGETLLGGASLFVGGTRSDPYSLNDQLRTNLAQNLTGQAAQDLRSVRIEESVTVEASTPVQVMILEAV